MKAFFEKHRSHFDGSKIRVTHIILRPAKNGDQEEVATLQAQAEQIRQDILAKKITFADAVAKYSMGPSRRQNGDLGFIERTGPMVPAFTEAAFNLKPGEISPVVITPFACTDSIDRNGIRTR